jgi:hypothetical protein
MPSKGPGPCPRCFGKRQREITLRGSLQPYCVPCGLTYREGRKEIAARRRRELRAERNSERGKAAAAEQARAEADKQHFRKHMPRPADNKFMPAEEIEHRTATGKRPQNLHGDLVLRTTPELVSLLDELVQLGHFGFTRESVALTLLRQKCEREMLFWHDRVIPVVATLK